MLEQVRVRVQEKGWLAIENPDAEWRGRIKSSQEALFLSILLIEED